MCQPGHATGCMCAAAAKKPWVTCKAAASATSPQNPAPTGKRGGLPCRRDGHRPRQPPPKPLHNNSRSVKPKACLVGAFLVAAMVA